MLMFWKKHGVADQFQLLFKFLKILFFATDVFRVCFVRDASGYTPFMFAVAHRAYPAALVIFSAAVGLSKDAAQDKEGTAGEESIFNKSSCKSPLDVCPAYQCQLKNNLSFFFDRFAAILLCLRQKIILYRG